MTYHDHGTVGWRTVRIVRYCPVLHGLVRSIFNYIQGTVRTGIVLLASVLSGPVCSGMVSLGKDHYSLSRYAVVWSGTEWSSAVHQSKVRIIINHVRGFVSYGKVKPCLARCCEVF